MQLANKSVGRDASSVFLSVGWVKVARFLGGAAQTNGLTSNALWVDMSCCRD